MGGMGNKMTKEERKIRRLERMEAREIRDAKRKVFRHAVAFAGWILDKGSTLAFELIYLEYQKYLVILEWEDDHYLDQEKSNLPGFSLYSNLTPQDIYNRLSSTQKQKWDNIEALKAWRQ